MVARRIDGVALADVAPAVSRLGADVIGQPPAPFVIHLEVRVGVAGEPDRRVELVAPAVREPAPEQLALRLVFRLALDRFSFRAQLLELVADRVVLAVSDLFSDAANVRHERLLIMQSGDSYFTFAGVPRGGGAFPTASRRLVSADGDPDKRGVERLDLFDRGALAVMVEDFFAVRRDAQIAEIADRRLVLALDV